MLLKMLLCMNLPLEKHPSYETSKLSFLVKDECISFCNECLFVHRIVSVKSACEGSVEMNWNLWVAC